VNSRRSLARNLPNTTPGGKIYGRVAAVLALVKASEVDFRLEPILRASMRSGALASLSKHSGGYYTPQACLLACGLMGSQNHGAPNAFFKSDVRAHAQTFQKIENGDGMSLARPPIVSLSEEFRTAIEFAAR
jgi:hypothetical protein